MVKKIKVFLFVTFGLLVRVSASEIFPISIDDVSGLNSPWPIVASLPFSQGELKDVNSIRIVSGGKEVPSQIDVTATWRDGSIKWALAGFTDSPKKEYMVEYGANVKRGNHPNPIKITKEVDGGYSVDTGVAVYQFDSDKLLFEKGWLTINKVKTPFLDKSGDGAYLVDNNGRVARISGKLSEVKNNVLKEGPGRFVVKRSGWYVTETGERLARGEAWFYFSSGSPYVKITHSLVVTSDTNKVWFKDYGFQFKTVSAPKDMYCAIEENSRETVKKYNLQSREIFMLQDQFPHFAETDFRGVIGTNDKVLEEVGKVGDWAYADYNDFGISIVMPWLAERFPKEISFGEKSGRAVLWSSRSGRELDFRSKTLAKEYWQSWVEKGKGSPGFDRLSRIPNNAQGSAHTHDIWFLPIVENKGLTELVKQTSTAGSRVPLAMASPERTCLTEAMEFPMYHKDTKKFPREEEYISDCWDRFTLSDKVFPMKGFINWGHCPYLGYHKSGKQWVASFTSYGNINSYNVRRNVWHLYARSGERRYFKYGHALNRILGDFGIAHWEAPGKPFGSFTRQLAPLSAYPHYWGNFHRKFDMGNSSSDIGNWLMEYYLTGNEQARDVTVMVGESIKRLWNLNEALDESKTLSFLALRILSILYMREWDPDFLKLSTELAHSLINLDKQTGVEPKYMSYFDAMYKDQRHTLDLHFYYQATGDELGKKAFLKILDHRYMYNRNEKALSYFNTSAFSYAVAYKITGNENYRRLAQETLVDSMNGFSSPLSKQLKTMGSDPSKWHTFPNLGNPIQTHPFLGIPTVLKMIAEKGYSEDTFPVLVKTNGITKSDLLFEHKKGEKTEISILYSTVLNSGLKPSVYNYPPGTKRSPLKGITLKIEERISGMVEETLNRPVSNVSHYNAKVSVPASFESGLYTISFDNTTSYMVLDSTARKIGLYSPDGFYSAAVSGKGTPLGMYKPFFFKVPEGLKSLELFLGGPQRISGPNGEEILKPDRANVGYVSIPVKNRYGFWNINVSSNQPAYFFKFLNIEPVISYATSETYPTQVGEKPLSEPIVLPKVEPTMEFVEGVSGKALQLTGNKTIRFPRGEEKGDNSYTYFPGYEGTIEFWYRPNWSTQDIVLPKADEFQLRSFLEGPHIHLGYRHGVRVNVSTYFSDIIMEILGTFPGAEDFRSFLKAKSLIGREEHHLFKSGLWEHIAYVWAYKPVEKALPDTPVYGDLKWPSRWRFFGPVDREDPILPNEILNSYPSTIEVKGKTFKAKEVSVFNTRYDFPAMLKQEPTGKTVYVFLKIYSPKQQKVTLGMGADWWMQAWLNGELIHDTTETSNKVFPFSIWNHMVDTNLKKGDNILAVRFIRGGGSVLALGGPRELKTPEASTLKWEFNIYVNGKRLDAYRTPSRDRFLRAPGDKLKAWQSKCDFINLANKNKDIVIGPLEGTIDLLRISDVVRYRENFVPSKTFKKDKNTKVLFQFDGDLKGVSHFEEEGVLAK
ncbi:hypothetical protein M0P98_08770 [bacterium]|nr:hypothetical protein [bacterium]